MVKCNSCGSTVLLGGKKEGNLTFCNDKCVQNGIIPRTAQDLPINQIETELKALREGSCPQCGGIGPVDLHFYHQVWSALYLTSHKSVPLLSCQKCGRKKQIFSALFSFFLGWWGFPWGLFYTPVQIFRNLKAILKPLDPALPSPALREVVTLDLARQLVGAQNAAVSATPPIASPFENAAPLAVNNLAVKGKTLPNDPFSKQDAFK